MSFLSVASWYRNKVETRNISMNKHYNIIPSSYNGVSVKSLLNSDRITNNGQMLKSVISWD